MFIFEKNNSNGPSLQIEFSFADSFSSHSKASLKLYVSGGKIVGIFFGFLCIFRDFWNFFGGRKVKEKLTDFTDVVAKRRRTMEKLKNFRGIRK